MNQGKEVKDKDIERNRPAEEGRRNDPDLRDDSAIQPGVQTISGSETDDRNAHVTRTASDNFRPEDESDKFADPDFDEVDKTDD
jgi:hypothetical protein